ncbi:hypothetical protein BDN70DRAFT_425087 [Pholiota conissans]|uniref:Uncharacterized protein n=1 Tax=Pholiota conissans TaxID=109636 RepID=A0A9P5YSI9_9AGAR|nr:hypothetical protein BDN70DRAFT_425087 [Pholiota conissans]
MSCPVPPILDAHPSVLTFIHPSDLLSFAHSASPSSYPRPPTSILNPTHPSTLVVCLSTVRITRVLTSMSHSSSRLGARPRVPQGSRPKTYPPLGRFIPFLRMSFSSRFSAIVRFKTLTEHIYSELPIVSILERFPPLYAIFFESSKALYYQSASENLITSIIIRWCIQSIACSLDFFFLF